MVFSRVGLAHLAQGPWRKLRTDTTGASQRRRRCAPSRVVRGATDHGILGAERAPGEQPLENAQPSEPAGNEDAIAHLGEIKTGVMETPLHPGGADQAGVGVKRTAVDRAARKRVE